MRLLHVETLKLDFFLEASRPQYAILSHTWGENEVIYDDITNSLEKARLKPSFEKIRGTCDLAKSQGYKYVWIDTCCIDKSSSAELSEAINSMFRWYRESSICYTYLSDVSVSSHEISGASADVLEKIKRTRWFTRGWTLQELIAPRHVEFYSRDWHALGTRSNLATVIAEVTSIEQHTFHEALQTLSVARRMSWAARRETSRSEDIAYCLMGIFDINMPLLYGEGGVKAFQRLQEQIMRQYDDHTLLAWFSNDHAPHGRGWMANHPREFRYSANYIPSRALVDYSVTERGLQIVLPVTCKRYHPPDRRLGPMFEVRPGEVLKAALACHRENTVMEQRVISLQPLDRNSSYADGSDILVVERVGLSKTQDEEVRRLGHTHRVKLFIPRDPIVSRLWQDSTVQYIRFGGSSSKIRFTAFYPSDIWNGAERTILLKSLLSAGASIEFSTTPLPIIFVLHFRVVDQQTEWRVSSRELDTTDVNCDTIVRPQIRMNYTFVTSSEWFHFSLQEREAQSTVSLGRSKTKDIRLVINTKLVRAQGIGIAEISLQVSEGKISRSERAPMISNNDGSPMENEQSSSFSFGRLLNTISHRSNGN